MTWQPDWWLVSAAGAVVVGMVVLAVRQWSRTGADRAALLVRVLVAVGLVVVALRPSGQHEVETPVTIAVDVVVMLDRTASMGATDHPGAVDRMEAAGEDLATAVAELAGAHVTVITFDDAARVAVPATTDAASVMTLLRTVGWRPSGKATGSDVSVGVELAAAELDSIAQRRPDSRRILLYAGDGEQTQGTPRSSFSELGERVDDAWVLGYGTHAGGAMPVARDDSALVERDGEVQRSVIDEQALEGIASELGGTYLRRTGEGDDLPRLAPVESTTARELVPGAEYYWIVALGLTPLLLALLVRAVRRWREVEEQW